MGLLRKVATALGAARRIEPGLVLQEATQQSLVVNPNHNYTSCQYSTRYRAWVRTCRDCGRVISC
jgi:hypothetical protein